MPPMSLYLKMVFDQFPGTWEVMQTPENAGAVAFWEKIVDRYADSCFQKLLKIIPVISITLTGKK